MKIEWTNDTRTGIALLGGLTKPIFSLLLLFIRKYSLTLLNTYC